MIKGFIAAAFAVLAIMSSAPHSDAARTTPRGGEDGKFRQSPPAPIAFDVVASVSLGKSASKASSFAAITLKPQGCTKDCTGYVQSSGQGMDNEMHLVTPNKGAVFNPVATETRSTGTPAPMLEVHVTNGGARQPMDTGSPIMTVTAEFNPVSINGGDAPPDTEGFSLSFGVMWTPGPGSPPNSAGTFSLVHPLPLVDFHGYGVSHRFSVVGVRPAAGAAACPGLQGRKLWWGKDWDDNRGFGAMVVPQDKQCTLEILGELSVLPV